MLKIKMLVSFGLSVLAIIGITLLTSACIATLAMVVFQLAFIYLILFAISTPMMILSLTPKRQAKPLSSRWAVIGTVEATFALALMGFLLLSGSKDPSWLFLVLFLCTGPLLIAYTYRKKSHLCSLLGTQDSSEPQEPISPA